MTVADPAAPRFAIPILFAVVFIDLVGFGILSPLVPFYAERLGARPELITLVIAGHPLAQSLCMPLWGRLSDRYGRRPVLLASMLGHALAYVAIGFAGSLWFLALARILSGATSANIATAYAYVADVTSPADRAAAMGRIAAAFGLGFAIGPALGGLLAGGDSMATANLVRPAIAAGLFSLAAFVAILVFLPESRPAGRQAGSRETVSLGADIRRVAARPVVSLMLVLATIVLVCMSTREAIFPLWANHAHQVSARTLGGLLAWTGLLVFSLQFFGLGRLVDRFGELALVRVALACLLVGWLGHALAVNLPSLVLAMTISACGTAFFQTCMQSLLSRRAGAAERGMVLGVYQSSSAMARFVGQAGAGTVYGQLGSNAPFLLGSLAMLPALYLSRLIGRRLATTSSLGSSLGSRPG
jgi:MFS family permease